MDCECLALCPEYSTCPINVRTLPLTSSLPRANFMSVRPVEPNRAHCSEGSQALSFMFCCHHLAICNTFSTRGPPIFPFYTGLSRLCSQPAYPSLLFLPFFKLPGFEELSILLVAQIGPLRWLPTRCSGGQSGAHGSTPLSQPWLRSYPSPARCYHHASAHGACE